MSTNKSNKSDLHDLSKYESTSKKIRYFRSLGHSVAEIERLLKSHGVTTKNGDPIRYQHVRNILTQSPLVK